MEKSCKVSIKLLYGRNVCIQAQDLLQHPHIRVIKSVQEIYISTLARKIDVMKSLNGKEARKLFEDGQIYSSTHPAKCFHFSLGLFLYLSVTSMLNRKNNFTLIIYI